MLNPRDLVYTLLYADTGVAVHKLHTRHHTIYNRRACNGEHGSDGKDIILLCATNHDTKGD